MTGNQQQQQQHSEVSYDVDLIAATIDHKNDSRQQHCQQRAALKRRMTSEMATNTPIRPPLAIATKSTSQTNCAVFSSGEGRSYRSGRCGATTEERVAPTRRGGRENARRLHGGRFFVAFLRLAENNDSTLGAKSIVGCYCLLISKLIELIVLVPTY